ncbi:hypothetical protein S40293_01038 [Stachybotrys chartarum IBT 40293]|nr:hypothetical protein S40293_01038 [Stachybotrys chartarum IBT 40293]
MCGTCNGDTAGSAAAPTATMPESASTSNGAYPARGKPKSSPYQSVQDYISNVNSFKIIESTLREGEQFANAFFDTETKIKIARAIDNFGCDYIELTSPVSSPQSYEDCKTICGLGLKVGLDVMFHLAAVHADNMFRPRFLPTFGVIVSPPPHASPWLKIQFILPCPTSPPSHGNSNKSQVEDAKKAVECGVQGVDLVIGTSSFLREYSHGKSMELIQKTALEVIEYLQRCGRLRYCGLEAGATHIDTSVLGIGERNGITPLGAFMARMVVTAPDYVTKKYNLKALKALEELVADAVQINIPFNNPITGFCAFTHKAGIHAKAILANPSTYEIIDPSLFGLTRYVSINSRITGWNAVKSRVEQLGLKMTDEQIKEVTAKIKQMADIRPLAIDDTDSIIRSYHLDLQQ